MKLNKKPEDYLKYDSTSKTGLRWIESPSRKVKAGDEAFTRIDSGGYYGGKFNYVSFSAHQIIMYLIHGKWSSRSLHCDHRDGNRLNNNIDNLRFVLPTGNQRNANRKIQSNNKSGVNGLSLWSNRGYTYWRGNYAGKYLYNKDKQVVIDWLEETRKSDPLYLTTN